ncbi:hypothetical protein DFP72DRAFT_1039445 [Ephemerocybe angulata]|uniref:Uncharacterized protein n=1 Tax=Ephemerocybe angulata TaxID=980116 RepID=A0A8H6IJW8_9AGAR|nr:hypothetical protein DFP72DRAFT_1039445 [Tulosesus angulatus]
MSTTSSEIDDIHASLTSMFFTSLSRAPVLRSPLKPPPPHHTPSSSSPTAIGPPTPTHSPASSKKTPTPSATPYGPTRGSRARTSSGPRSGFLGRRRGGRDVGGVVGGVEARIEKKRRVWCLLSPPSQPAAPPSPSPPKSYRHSPSFSPNSYRTKYLNPAADRVALGGVPEITEILELKCDARIARTISAAAKHLTPMILELGGRARLSSMVPILGGSLIVVVFGFRLGAMRWGGAFFTPRERRSGKWDDDAVGGWEAGPCAQFAFAFVFVFDVGVGVCLVYAWHNTGWVVLETMCGGDSWGGFGRKGDLPSFVFSRSCRICLGLSVFVFVFELGVGSGVGVGVGAMDVDVQRGHSHLGCTESVERCFIGKRLAHMCVHGVYSFRFMGAVELYRKWVWGFALRGDDDELAREFLTSGCTGDCRPFRLHSALRLRTMLGLSRRSRFCGVAYGQGGCGRYVSVTLGLLDAIEFHSCFFGLDATMCCCAHYSFRMTGRPVSCVGQVMSTYEVVGDVESLFPVSVNSSLFLAPRRDRSMAGYTNISILASLLCFNIYNSFVSGIL